MHIWCSIQRIRIASRVKSVDKLHEKNLSFPYTKRVDFCVKNGARQESVWRRWLTNAQTMNRQRQRMWLFATSSIISSFFGRGLCQLPTLPSNDATNGMCHARHICVDNPWSGRVWQRRLEKARECERQRERVHSTVHIAKYINFAILDVYWHSVMYSVCWTSSKLNSVPLVAASLAREWDFCCWPRMASWKKMESSSLNLPKK